MCSYHYHALNNHAYQKNAQLDLENFSFVPLPREAGLRKFCVRTNTTRTTNSRDWTYKIFAFVLYDALLDLRKFCVRTNTTGTTTTRGWTWKILCSYHYHARLDLEYFVFVPLSRAASLKKIFAFVPLPRGPLPHASGLRKFCLRTTTKRTTTTRTTTTRGWTWNILRSYHNHARHTLRKFCVLTTTTRTTTTRSSN